MITALKRLKQFSSDGKKIMNNENVSLAEKDLLPAYSAFLYGDIYNNLERSISMDTKFSANLRTFFQYNTLVSSLLKNIKKNQTVLQMGLVFGNEIDSVAQAIGSYGQYDIIDINSLQISRNQEKYGNIYPAMKIIQQDAATFKSTTKYDVVICFLLLQELPPVTKGKVINNALEALKDGGCAVFVDYHKPVFWHPLRYFVRMYNRLKHPFVEKLWDKEIDTFAKNKTEYSWLKSVFFGGMFQKVVATKKGNPLAEIVVAEANPKEEDFFLPDF